MKISRIITMTIISSCLFSADFESEVRSDSEKINEFVQGIDFTKYGYDLIEINKKILNQFDEKVRTPTQSFIIGNMLYSADPGISYALHEEAYNKIKTKEPFVLLEWAMELQRKKLFGKSFLVYEEFIKLNSDYAPVYGLMADCCIQQGRIEDAVKYWEKSEKSKNGSLEKLEELVCEVYKDSGKNLERNRLIGKAKAGDLASVLSLIEMDCKFESDWWNIGPQIAYLKADMHLLDSFKEGDVKLARCLSEIIIEREGGDEVVLRVILKKYHEPITSLLEVKENEWKLYSILLGNCFENKLYNKSDYKSKYLNKLIEISKNSSNPELFNIISSILVDDPAYLENAEQGWFKTGDERFAIGYLNEIMSSKKVDVNDKVLVEAMKKFPLNSNLWYAKWTINNKLSKDDTILAIKSEYNRFSITATGLDFPRPRAAQLRRYFKQLSTTITPQ